MIFLVEASKSDSLPKKREKNKQTLNFGMHLPVFFFLPNFWNLVTKKRPLGIGLKEFDH
jgi:hypothetical protein